MSPVDTGAVGLLGAAKVCGCPDFEKENRDTHVMKSINIDKDRRENVVS